MGQNREGGLPVWVFDEVLQAVVFLYHIKHAGKKLAELSAKRFKQDRSGHKGKVNVDPRAGFKGYKLGSDDKGPRQRGAILMNGEVIERAPIQNRFDHRLVFAVHTVITGPGAQPPIGSNTRTHIAM